MGSEGRDVEVRRRSEARRGQRGIERVRLSRHPFSINRKIFALNLLYVGTDAKMFRRGYR